MDNDRIDAMARALGTDARRRALLGKVGASALGTLGLAALGASGADAKRGGNKKNKCKKQVSRCKQGLAELCAALFPEPEGFNAGDCTEAFGPCCQQLGDCDAARAFDCAVATVELLQSL
jgi:hypothetical protein